MSEPIQEQTETVEAPRTGSRFGAYVAETVIGRTVLVLAIVVIGFILMSDTVARWDLTEDQRFSISPYSHRLAAELEDPLTIRTYFTGELPASVEHLRQQVWDILSEYEAHSGGKVRIEHFDPEDSKAAESEAKNYGLQPVNLQIYAGSGVQVLRVYGGLVLLYRDRASEVINVAARFPEGYEGLSVIEYEISSRIWQLTHERPKVGLTGSLMSAGAQQPFGRPQPPRNEFGALRQLLGEAVDIEDVDLKSEAPDPKEMPLLLLVRPREMADVEIFRLDQYLMKGGRLLLFMTQGEVQFPSPMSGNQFGFRPFKTGLDAWLAHQGLRVPNEFVVQANSARPIPLPHPEFPQIQVPTPNLFWPMIFAADFNQDNPAVRTLKGATFYWPHPVDVIESRIGADRTATVLARSRASESWLWKDLARADLRQLIRSDRPSPEELRSSNLCVALEGKFESFFKERPVPPSLMETPEDGGEDAKPVAPEVVKETANPTQLVVVGNAVFLQEPFLMIDPRGGGLDRIKQDALLALNLVDWLARSPELIALRAKKFASRRLEDKQFNEEIDAITKEAENAGEMTKEFRQRWDKASEGQKSRRSYWRWFNVLLPAGIVLVLGALVWILRVVLRAAGGTPSPRTGAEQ